MAQDTSSNSKRIARNTAFLYFRMLFNMVVTLYTSRVVLSMLGETDFGIYGVVGGFVTMFSFLNTSMTNSVQRFFNFEWGKYGQQAIGKVYSHALVIQTILAIILVVALESLGVWYINNIMVIPLERLDTANWIFQFSVISLAVVVISVPYGAAVMAHERMDFYAIVGMLDVCLKLMLAIALKYTSADKLWFWGLLTPLTSIFTFSCYFMYSKWNFVYVKFERCFDKVMIVDMLSFAGWNLFGSMSGVMKEQGINLVLNFFFGPVVNAARAIASQVSGAVMGFVGNISIAVRPQLTKSYAEGNVDTALRYMYTISKINYLSFLFFALPLALEIRIVLHAWLGEYPNHSETFVVLVFLTCAVNLLNAPVSMIVHASGKMRNYQIVGSCLSMLGVPVAFVGHYFCDIKPEFSLFAIFVSTLLGQCASIYILKNIVSRFSVSEYCHEVVRPIIFVSFVGSLIPVVIRFSIADSVIRFFAVTAISCICIAITTYTLALNNAEKNMVNAMAGKCLRRK